MALSLLGLLSIVLVAFIGGMIVNIYLYSHGVLPKSKMTPRGIVKKTMVKPDLPESYSGSQKS